MSVCGMQHLRMWVNCQQILIFGWTISVTELINGIVLILFLGIVEVYKLVLKVKNERNAMHFQALCILLSVCWCPFSPPVPC